MYSFWIVFLENMGLDDAEVYFRSDVLHVCSCEQEIHTLKTQLEAAKYDVIKYCIGTVLPRCCLGFCVYSFILSPVSWYGTLVIISELAVL